MSLFPQASLLCTRMPQPTRARLAALAGCLGWQSGLHWHRRCAPSSLPSWCPCTGSQALLPKRLQGMSWAASCLCAESHKVAMLHRVHARLCCKPHRKAIAQSNSDNLFCHIAVCTLRVSKHRCSQAYAKEPEVCC